MRKIAVLPPEVSIKDYYVNKDKILIWHEKGGLGDVFMQRMLISDFKKLSPTSEIHFACLPEYFDAVYDHPDITQVWDARKINTQQFGIVYNTCVTIADRYENKYAPNCTAHRSDIWAASCGVNLESHDMKFNLPENLIQKCKDEISTIIQPNKPLVILAPISKMSNKTLLPHQLEAVLNALKNCNVIIMHNKEIPNVNIPVLNKSIKEFMGYIHLADYVISVDTAAFHLAGGMNKPCLGIFTFADGKTYGKYFKNTELVQLHRDNGNWACGPCFKFGECPKCKTHLKPCLTEITEEMLTTGISKLFNRFPIKIA